MNFCPKAGAKLFPLVCKFLQGNTIASDHRNKIVANTPTGKIILESATARLNINIKDLHIELSYPSETITQETSNALGIQVTGTFKSCEDCALVKAKQCSVSKKGCTLFANFRGIAFLQHDLPIYSYFWQKAPLATSHR